MPKVTITVPDDVADLLSAKVAARGLTLEDWFRICAQQEIRLHKPRYTLAELVAKCDVNSSFSDEDREGL